MRSTTTALFFTALTAGALTACAPNMTRSLDGNVIVVGHEANGFSAALEHALDLCIEQKMNIRHISTEPGATPATRVSRFECVRR